MILARSSGIVKILFILFMTQLVGCAPSTILAIPQSISDRRTTEVQITDQKIFLAAWSPVQEIADNESQKSHFNIILEKHIYGN